MRPRDLDQACKRHPELKCRYVYFVPILIVSILVTSCTGNSGSSTTASRTPTRTDHTVCANALRYGTPPRWAASGFTPGVKMWYVMGSRDNIVGFLFGYPLSHKHRESRTNKILWVARVDTPNDVHYSGPPGTMTIRARLVGSNRQATRVLKDAPGPSIVDMPSAGCWEFALAWQGNSDSVSVAYT